MAPSLYLVRMPEIESDEPELIGRRLIVIPLDERMEAEDAAPQPMRALQFDVEFQLCDIDLEDVCIDVDSDPSLILADEPLALAA